MKAPVGDSHNFGKRVSAISDTALLKPRVVTWEYLLLNRNSPLRALLENIFKDQTLNPTNYLPDLWVDQTDWFSGKVERFPTEELVRPIRINLADMGACIALWSWLGLTDLHRDNLVFGVWHDRTYFFPIDIESMFYNLNTINDTLLLLPSSLTAPGIEGLSILRQYVKTDSDISSLAEGFNCTIRLLSNNKDSMERLKSDLSLQTIATRVIFRATSTYSEFIWQQSIPNICLISEEIEQVNRGDIPYFFKFFGQSGIYYFHQKSSYKKLESDIAPIYFLTETDFSAEWCEEKIQIFTAQLIFDFSRTITIHKIRDLQAIGNQTGATCVVQL